MKSLFPYLKIAASFASAAVFFVFNGLAFFSTIVGFSAIPDDTTRSISLVSKVLDAIPFWVLVGLSIGLLCLATYLMISGLRSLMRLEPLTVDLPTGYMTADQAQEIMSLTIQIAGLEQNTREILRMHGNLGERVDNYKNDLEGALSTSNQTSEDVMQAVGRLYDQQQELAKSIQTPRVKLQSFEATEEETPR